MIARRGLTFPRRESPASRSFRRGILHRRAVGALAAGIFLSAAGCERSPHAPGTAGDAGPGSVIVELAPRQGAVDSLVSYYCPEKVTLSAEKPEGVVSEPKYRSPRPLYGILGLGTGPRARIALAVDEVPGEPPRIFIDRNNNGDLADDGGGDWTETTQDVSELKQAVIEVPYDGRSIPSAFSFYRFTGKYGDTIFYYRDSYRAGELALGGLPCQIALLEDNADGRFDDLEEGVLLIDLNRDGVLEGKRDSAEFHALEKPFNLDGRVWEAASVSPDGTRLTIRPSAAKLPPRRYFNPGDPAPEFSGTTLEGKAFDLAGLRGKSKYILIDFWASWCGPCRSEYPRLRSAWAGYRNRGLAIVGVNLDKNRDQAVAAAKENGLDYPHLCDGQGWAGGIVSLYQVRGIPKMFLLDSDLKIVARDLDGRRLGERLRELLGPGDAAAAAPVPAPSAAEQSSLRPLPPSSPRLTGVLVRAEGAGSAALIASPDGRAEGVFHVGDAVGEASVSAISPGEVVLERQGGRDLLRLPSRPPSAPSAPDTIALDFENADIRAVIRLFSELTGTNFILGDHVRGSVTVLTAKPIPAGEAMAALASILETRGLVMVPAGSFVKVTAKAEGTRSNVPVAGEGRAKGEGATK